MTITQETKKESWDRIKPNKSTRQDIVLAILIKWTTFPEPVAMTAEDIAYRMGREIYTIRPRLTELLQAGKIRSVSKKMSLKTGKKIALYQPCT